MPVINFHLTSTLNAADVIAVLTDFGPSRPARWPTIDTDHFQVHAVGETWAEVTEGTASAWERSRYEWDHQRGLVMITTHDSKVFGPGGGWVFQLTPDGRGTRIDVELTRNPVGLKRKALAALLPVVAPSALRRSFTDPLKAV